MNTYHFTITYFFSKPGQAEYSKPIYAESYSQALETLYRDDRIIGAALVALRLWSGLTLIDHESLFNPAVYDMPNLSQF
jgi:hypothetical protein